MVLSCVVSTIFSIVLLAIFQIQSYINPFPLAWCAVFPFIMVRKRIREIKGINGSFCEDFWVVWCLPCCTMIQAKREFDDYVVLKIF